MLMKASWIEYKKEYNRFKKFEKRLQKVQKLYSQYEEKADQILIDPSQSDMSCGINCINTKKQPHQILQCLNTTCSIKFQGDLQQILEVVEARELDDSFVALQSEEEEEDVQNTQIEEIEQEIEQCNNTCTQDCEVVKQVLDESYYLHCMKQRCGCEDIDLPTQDTSDSLFLQLSDGLKIQEQSSFFPKLEFILIIVCSIIIILSIIVGAIAWKVPIFGKSKTNKPKKKEKVEEVNKNEGKQKMFQKATKKKVFVGEGHYQRLPKSD